jgi:outer membrane protein assembly factor BamB
MNHFTRKQWLTIFTVLAGFVLLSISRPTQAIRPPSLSDSLLSRVGQGEVDLDQAVSQAILPGNAEMASFHVFLPVIAKPPDVSWSMAGANPQRTSWTLEEVRGQLRPIWYKPIEPYISQKVQIIAANDTLYISTARGLYALSVEDGGVRWVFPTEMPLGNSPTIYNGVAYVPGLDHKLYALNAFTGQQLWTFEASRGFDTNPLVIGNKVYLGNRDGYLYAIYSHDDPSHGQLAWKFKTDGPIHFSAAYADGVLYFASDDSHAYAVDAVTGEPVWKSAKLPGAGFHSWWPVIYQDKVIFAGSNNYRSLVDPFRGPIQPLEVEDVYPDHLTAPRGTLIGARGYQPGSWVAGTATLDDSRVTQYLEAKPWRRTMFILDRNTGQELTFDYDHDGKVEYSPFLWSTTKGQGNRYPPVIGADQVLYASNHYMSAPYIPGGHISGWKDGTPFISLVSSRWTPADEGIAYSAGGRVIYWNHTTARSAGAFDYTMPNAAFPNRDPQREWLYWDYNLPTIIPGFPGEDWRYGGADGTYGSAGDQNPPIPYRGKLYVHRANGIIALGSFSGTPVVLPSAPAVTVRDADVTSPSTDALRQQLAAEIQKILDAGHLRSGYFSSGLGDLLFNWTMGDKLQDYFHNPADTYVTLGSALPHLDPVMQQQVRQYLQTEFAAYPACGIGTLGFAVGASREAFDLPPEVEAVQGQFGATFYGSNVYDGWNYEVGCAPYSFYGLWKYAQTFGGAKALFDKYKNELQPPPSDAILDLHPQAHNAYIAGYWGYLELEKLAGYAESANIRSTLNRLLTLRASTFTKENKARNTFVDANGVVFAASRNFMYLTPELAQYLHDHALSKMQDAVDYYNTIAPYWFVSKIEDYGAEGNVQPLYDVSALFQARALILKQPRSELIKYLDVPAFARGDLFYLQNLIAVLDAN